MKILLSPRGKMKISYLGIIVCLLILIFSLSACSGPTFPTGLFSMKFDDTYAIEFSEDGKFTYLVFGTVITSGTYSIQGDEFNIETDSICDAEDSGKATYTWTWDDGMLTFTLKGEDRCDSRRGVMDNVAYVEELDVETTQQKIGVEAIKNDLSGIAPVNPDQLTSIYAPITEPVAVIWDDDGSIDGVTALLYLIAHPSLEVKAATISPGIAHPQLFAPKLANLLKMQGLGGTPVAAGPEKPLSGNKAFPDEWRNASDNFWGIDLSYTSSSIDERTGAELIIDVLHESEDPVIIFVSGPLTNLAQALRINPSIKDQIRSVEIMGGAVEIEGNVSTSPSAEWNIYIDPEAANEVFASGLEIYLTPLDATDRIMWTDSDAAAWKASYTPTGSMAAQLLQKTIEDWSSPSVIVWDLVAAMNVVDRRLCQWKQVHLEVNHYSPDDTGRIIADTGKPSNVYVCLIPDSDAYHTLAESIFGEK